MKNKFGRCQTEEELHANVATGGTLCEPSGKIKTREFKDVNINYLYLHVNVHISSKLLIWDCVRAKLYVFPRRGVTMLILRSIIRLRNRIRDSASIVFIFQTAWLVLQRTHLTEIYSVPKILFWFVFWEEGLLWTDLRSQTFVSWEYDLNSSETDPQKHTRLKPLMLASAWYTYAGTWQTLSTNVSQSWRLRSTTKAV